MGKIGLITTSHAINYGAVLQAFSLKKALEAYTNQTVDIINYCGNEQVAGRRLYRPFNSIKNIIVNLFIFFNRGYRTSRTKLVSLFDKFKRDYLQIHSKLLSSEEELRNIYNYKTFVCGSDQIWNLNLFNDPIYFLSFARDGAIKIAYAVSISDKMSAAQMIEIAAHAKSFKLLSVREADDAKSLSDALDERKVENIIDPVFLHSADEWKSLLSLNLNSYGDKYLLVFLIAHQIDDQQIVDIVKGNSKVKVINLHPFKYITGDVMIQSASPKDFVELIANADAILTDSFHCTAFSIIFHKKFFNIKRPSRNNRIENLYEKFHIQSRYVSLDNCISLTEKINYKTVDHIMSDELEKAHKFMQNI